MGERFTLVGALQAVDDAVTSFAEPVLLVGHSLGGYVSMEYAGRKAGGRQLAGLVPCDCTAAPRGLARGGYAASAKWLESLPDDGAFLNNVLAHVFLPAQGRADLEVGGYALNVMVDGVAAITGTDPLEMLSRLTIPVWFVNGTWDHFRLDEKHFLAAAPNSHLRLVGGAHHVMPLVRPVAFTRAIFEIYTEVSAQK